MDGERTEANMNELKRKREPAAILVSRKALRELIDEAVEKAFRRRDLRAMAGRGGKAKSATRPISCARCGERLYRIILWDVFAGAEPRDNGCRRSAR
jgi:hypothetical protein